MSDKTEEFGQAPSEPHDEYGRAVKYAYDVSEQSVDKRNWKVVSDKPLSEETVEQIYRQVSEFKDNTTEDVSEYASELEGTEVKVAVTFEYTDFGDDCDVMVSDVYEEEA